VSEREERREREREVRTFNTPHAVNKPKTNPTPTATATANSTHCVSANGSCPRCGTVWHGVAEGGMGRGSGADSYSHSLSPVKRQRCRG